MTAWKPEARRVSIAQKTTMVVIPRDKSVFSKGAGL